MLKFNSKHLFRSLIFCLVLSVSFFSNLQAGSPFDLCRTAIDRLAQVRPIQAVTNATLGAGRWVRGSFTKGLHGPSWTEFAKDLPKDHILFFKFPRDQHLIVFQEETDKGLVPRAYFLVPLSLTRNQIPAFNQQSVEGSEKTAPADGLVHAVFRLDPKSWPADLDRLIIFSLSPTSRTSGEERVLTSNPQVSERASLIRALNEAPSISLIDTIPWSNSNRLALEVKNLLGLADSDLAAGQIRVTDFFSGGVRGLKDQLVDKKDRRSVRLYSGAGILSRLALTATLGLGIGFYPWMDESQWDGQGRGLVAHYRETVPALRSFFQIEQSAAYLYLVGTYERPHEAKDSKEELKSWIQRVENFEKNLMNADFVSKWGSDLLKEPIYFIPKEGSSLAYGFEDLWISLSVLDSWFPNNQLARDSDSTKKASRFKTRDFEGTNGETLKLVRLAEVLELLDLSDLTRGRSLHDSILDLIAALPTAELPSASPKNPDWRAILTFKLEKERRLHQPFLDYLNSPN